VLGVQDFDVGIVLHHGVEAFHALVVDRCRNAPKDHNIALTIENTGQILGGYLGKSGIVTRNIGVLRARVRQPAIYYGHVNSFVLQLRHGLGERGRLKR